MARSVFHKKQFFTMTILSLACLTTCSFENYRYRGSVKFQDHKWLMNRKIFIDPGHGGLGNSDKSRIGPNNITEEEVNLKVGLLLEDMLKSAGAIVKMSRRRDVDIILDDRVKMAADFKPELLVSIHHNNSARKEDAVNYPFVFIWGNRHVKPESYDFALYLQEELNKIMDVKGFVMSDFSVFSETGTRILRETRYLCPGALGEAGFFTDPKHAVHLSDIHYNELEAEAYFMAISQYFSRGAPSAEAVISCPIEDENGRINLIKERNPVVSIIIRSDCEKKGIEPGSLNVTLNNIPVKTIKITDEIYRIDYGRSLYPGGNSFRFQFRNLKSHNSMVYNIPIMVDTKNGDFSYLINEGRKLLNDGINTGEGLKMLLAAYSIEKTDPGIDQVLHDIARGFYLLGDTANSEYYYNRLYFFYPQSPLINWKSYNISRNYSFRHPVDYYGKRADLTGDVDIDRYIKDSPESSLERWLARIKKRLQVKK